MNKYEDLKVWNKAMDFVEQVYLLASDLPNDEKFGLVSQLKRCSVSIPSNIAEGAGRNSKKEFVRFLSMANKSTAELETQILLLERLNLIDLDRITPILDLSNEIRKMNFSLQKSITKES